MVVVVSSVSISVFAAAKSGTAVTSYDPEELYFLGFINECRQEHGACGLILSDPLAVAAEHHPKLDPSRFVSRTVYVGFHVRTEPILLRTFYLDNVVRERGSRLAAGS